jgi:ATP-dependent DNA helicase PIF1
LHGAITIHKAQGITAEKIVTNIAQKDHAIRLSYVAISRVKTLRGLLFEESFDFSRFKTKAPSKAETMRLADYAKSLPQHAPVVVPVIDKDLCGA